MKLLFLEEGLEMLARFRTYLIGAEEEVETKRPVSPDADERNRRLMRTQQVRLAQRQEELDECNAEIEAAKIKKDAVALRKLLPERNRLVTETNALRAQIQNHRTATDSVDKARSYQEQAAAMKDSAHQMKDVTSQLDVDDLAETVDQLKGGMADIEAFGRELSTPLFDELDTLSNPDTGLDVDDEIAQMLAPDASAPEMPDVPATKSMEERIAKLKMKNV